MPYAFRVFARSKGLAAAAVLSLGIGIGANTAIFSVTHALLLQSLPYQDADRLVILWNRSPGLNIAEDWFSTAQYFDIARGYDGFEPLAIAIGSNMNLTGGGDPERIGVIRVSSNLLPMLGARAEAGRLFRADEDVPGKAATAVLGHTMWVRRFGGDPAVVGKTLLLNGQSIEVIGVLPEWFTLPREVLPTLGVADDGDVFLPLPLAESAATVRTREDYNIIGKLKPGVAASAAQAAMDTITARLRRDHPDVYPPNSGLTFSIVPLHEQVVGNVRTPLIVISGAVGFVLLIACANVANLLLSRAVARRKEMAIRASLGASRSAIIRQLLGESLWLALAGGALGLLLAVAGVAWIHAVQPANVPRLRAIGINLDVLMFTTLVSATAGVLFGLAPAMGVGRLDLHATLKDASRGSGAGALWRRGHGVRRTLAIAEVALAVVLVIGAGLLVRSFARLHAVPPGFRPDGVLTLELTFNGRKYPDGPTVQRTYRDLWTRLDAIPGVTASGGVTSLPMSGFFAWGPITVEGRVPPPGENFINADQRTVGGRYFDAMGIPLVRGRFFDDHDTPDQPRVVIVDDRMATDLWPGQDPIGKRIHFGDAKAESPWETVVGVVGRVKQYGLDADARIAMYRPHSQSASRALFVVVRSARPQDPTLAASVRAAVQSLDADVPLHRVRPMTALVDASLARQRFSLWLLGIFAGVAVTLASIGLYGVMAYLVAQSTRELGIRIALGATGFQIQRMIVGHGAVVAGIGLTIGLAAAVALGRVVEGLLFGIRPTDPLTLAAVAAGLALVAVVACYVPARRASRVDPMSSLRSE